MYKPSTSWLSWPKSHIKGRILPGRACTRYTRWRNGIWPVKKYKFICVSGYTKTLCRVDGTKEWWNSYLWLSLEKGYASFFFFMNVQHNTLARMEIIDENEPAFGPYWGKIGHVITYQLVHIIKSVTTKPPLFLVFQLPVTRILNFSFVGYNFNMFGI